MKLTTTAVDWSSMSGRGTTYTATNSTIVAPTALASEIAGVISSVSRREIVRPESSGRPSTRRRIGRGRLSRANKTLTKALGDA